MQTAHDLPRHMAWPDVELASMVAQAKWVNGDAKNLERNPDGIPLSLALVLCNQNSIQEGALCGSEMPIFIVLPSRSD